MGDMIVRIMGEGQVRLADSHLTELNKLDDVLLQELGEEGEHRGRHLEPCGPVEEGDAAARPERPRDARAEQVLQSRVNGS